MEKIKNYFNNKKDILLVAFFIIFILSIPLMQNGLLLGDDYDYHLSRIQSITNSLKNGIFPVKIHFELANSYGYGSGLFYPNLFLYIPALINLITSNLFISYKIFIVLMLTFMFFITYISLKTITEEKNSALIGTIIIMLSRSLILNLYERFALGEFLGYIFIAPVIAGMYDYVHKDFKKPYLLIIGFLGLVNTHIISTLICFIFCILYFIININSTIKNPKKFLKLILVAIIVALISAAFWMPFVQQYFSQTYKLSDPWTNISEETYSVIDLLGNNKYSIGFLATLCIPFIIYGLFDRNISNKYKIFAVLSLLVMLIAVNISFWKYTNDFSNIIQFKWRLIGIITVLLSFSTSCMLKDYLEKFDFKIEYLLVIVLLTAIYFTINYMNFIEPINSVESLDKIQKNMYMNETSIGGGKEYLPIEVDYKNLNTPLQAISNSDEKTNITKSALTCEFEKNDITSIWFDVPYIYYYGYVANITTPEGEVIPLSIEKSDNGLVRVKTPENETGTIKVWYNGTKLQKISYIISLISIITLSSYAIIKKFLKNKTN